MTRKTSGPKDPKNGAGKHGSTPKDPASGENPEKNAKSPGAASKGADIISLTTSPAFDFWLARQTKKLVQASSTKPNEALLDLIRGWPANNPKKGPGKITD